jgi:hypothetical protein
MKASRTVGRSIRAAWVTRAEAAFLARVPPEEIDRWVATGRLVTRQIGAHVFVDLGRLSEPAPVERSIAAIETPVVRVDPSASPVEARSVRGARARSGRALPAGGAKRRRSRPTMRRRLAPGPAAVIGGAAGLTAIVLLVLQVALFGGTHRGVTSGLAAASGAPATSSPSSIPVGRDPFASPFGAPVEGDEHRGVLVKPPGVVREGDAVTAATTVVNRNPDRWLPPSEVTFLARNQTGHVIARATTTVSLGPGRAQTVVAPDLGVDPSAIAAIEAHIDPAPLRSGRYRVPRVRVARAALIEDAKAIGGVLDVRAGGGAEAQLSCVVFGSLDELSAVSTTSVDLSRARHGRLRFWLTAQPTTPGPYRVSCSTA